MNRGLRTTRNRGKVRLPQPVPGVQHAGIAALLLSVVAPKLIEGGVDMAAKALLAAGEAKEDTLEARTSGFYYISSHEGDNKLNARCLIVVEAAAFDSGTPPEKHTTWAQDTTSLQAFKQPRMVFMAGIRPVPEGKFVTLQPAYLELHGARASGWFSSDGKRDYNFAISMEVPGGAKPFASVTLNLKGVPSTGTYTSTHPLLQGAESVPVPMPEISAPGQVVLGKLAEIWAPKTKAAAILDRYVRRNDPQPPQQPTLFPTDAPTVAARTNFCDALAAANAKRPRTAFVSDPTCDYQVADARGELAKAVSAMEISPPMVAWAYDACYEDQVVRRTAIAHPPTDGHSCSVPDQAQKLAKKTYSYFATHVVATEVRPGSKFAKFLGEALNASKADVSKALASKIPALTNEQKAAEDESERLARRGVLEADLAVEAAEATLAATPDAPAAAKTQAKLALLKAKFSANDAYRKAGRVPPYLEAD